MTQGAGGRGWLVGWRYRQISKGSSSAALKPKRCKVNRFVTCYCPSESSWRDLQDFHAFLHRSNLNFSAKQKRSSRRFAECSLSKMFANFCIAEATICQFPHEYFKGRNSGILDLIPTSWVNRRKRFMQKLVLSKKANLKPCEVAESGRRHTLKLPS